jgi:hypothetical protein
VGRQSCSNLKSHSRNCQTSTASPAKPGGLPSYQHLLRNHRDTWSTQQIEESLRQSFAVSHRHESAVSTIAKNLSRTGWAIGGDDRQVGSTAIALRIAAPVTPGVSYVASAWVKSEELQSANGPRLAIYDGYKNIEYGHSEETLGTTSWHRLETTFTANPDVTLILIRIGVST